MRCCWWGESGGNSAFLAQDRIHCDFSIFSLSSSEITNSDHAHAPLIVVVWCVRPLVVGGRRNPRWQNRRVADQNFFWGGALRCTCQSRWCRSLKRSTHRFGICLPITSGTSHTCCGFGRTAAFAIPSTRVLRLFPKRFLRIFGGTWIPSGLYARGISRSFRETILINTPVHTNPWISLAGL